MLDETKLSEWFKGNTDSVGFILTIFSVFEIWDDLIDKDKTPTSSEINNAFHQVFNLSRNVFYRQHFDIISPIIETVILDWYTANELEKTKDLEALRQSYVLRCGAQQLIVMCARILGGVDHAVVVNLELRMMGDTFEQYANKHGV